MLNFDNVDKKKRAMNEYILNINYIAVTDG